MHAILLLKPLVLEFLKVNKHIYLAAELGFESGNMGKASSRRRLALTRFESAASLVGGMFWRGGLGRNGLRQGWLLRSQEKKTLVTPRWYHDAKRILDNPTATRVSWLRNVVSDVLPLTTETIPHTSGVDTALAVTYCPSQEARFDKETNILKRRVDDSYLEIILPFSEHEKLREGFAKPNGHSIRYGKLFEILDALAADVGYRHAGSREDGLTIVTASVDELKMFADISLNNDLRLQAYLSYVGKSSMEVTIDMISIPQENDPVFIGTTHFVMVARNKLGRASPVFPILSKNPEYASIFAAGQERHNKRRARSSNSFDYSPPHPDEIQLIHDLYKQGRNFEKQLSSHYHTNNTSVAVNPTITRTASDNNDNGATNATVAEKVPTIWMDRTMFQNTKFMHLQNRNIHGKIFGGYIMRAAFELSWVTAVCFLGEGNTEFLYVHDIQFVLPVNVGSIVEFKSAVVYSESNYIVVQVEAMDVNPNTRQHTRTNLFSYIFHTKDKEFSNRPNADKRDDVPISAGSVPAPLVMPHTYEQIIMYLDGRRSLRNMLSGTCEIQTETDILSTEAKKPHS